MVAQRLGKMARRFQTSRRFQQGTRRKTMWVGGVSTGSQTPTTIAANSVAIVSVFDARLFPEAAQATVVRVRGILQIGNLGISSGNDPVGAFGIMVVDGEAFDAGVGSVSTPWTESGNNAWLYHTYWGAQQQVAGGAAIAMNSNIIIDSRAMRKLPQGRVVVNVIENASGADAAQFHFNVRMLLKLA